MTPSSYPPKCTLLIQFHLQITVVSDTWENLPGKTCLIGEVKASTALPDSSHPSSPPFPFSASLSSSSPPSFPHVWLALTPDRRSHGLVQHRRRQRQPLLGPLLVRRRLHGSSARGRRRNGAQEPDRHGKYYGYAAGCKLLCYRLVGVWTSICVRKRDWMGGNSTRQGERFKKKHHGGPRWVMDGGWKTDFPKRHRGTFAFSFWTRIRYFPLVY